LYAGGCSSNQLTRTQTVSGKREQKAKSSESEHEAAGVCSVQVVEGIDTTVGEKP
jgi:hypothetical protein